MVKMRFLGTREYVYLFLFAGSKENKIYFCYVSIFNCLFHFKHVQNSTKQAEPWKERKITFKLVLLLVLASWKLCFPLTFFFLLGHTYARRITILVQVILSVPSSLPSRVISCYALKVATGLNQMSPIWQG